MLTPVFLTGMCGKVVDGHLHFLTLFQSLQRHPQQFQVKWVRVVKVILTTLSHLMLLFWQRLSFKTVHWQILSHLSMNHPSKAYFFPFLWWYPQLFAGGQLAASAYLVEGVHGHRADPLYIQCLNDALSHRGLAWGTTSTYTCTNHPKERPVLSCTTNAMCLCIDEYLQLQLSDLAILTNNKGLLQLSLRVVPWWPACSVDGARAWPDHSILWRCWCAWGTCASPARWPGPDGALGGYQMHGALHWWYINWWWHLLVDLVMVLAAATVQGEDCRGNYHAGIFSHSTDNDTLKLPTLPYFTIQQEAEVKGSGTHALCSKKPRQLMLL